MMKEQEDMFESEKRTDKKRLASNLLENNSELDRIIAEKLIQIDELESKNRNLNSENEKLRKRNKSLKRRVKKQKLEITNLKVPENNTYSRLIRSFLANLSHEIKTPLNGIVGFSGLLIKHASAEEKISEYVKVIEESSNQLQEIIEDILDLSRLESGEYTPSIRQICLQNEFINICESYRDRIEAKNLQFKLRVQSENNFAIVQTDSYLFKRVLTHLLENAIKFTWKGEIEVYLYEITDESYSFVISDTGIGISDESQESVFSEFHQLDSSDGRKFGGLGIGLSIVKEFLKFGGGSFKLTSSPQKGSRFDVKIPITKG